MTKALSLHARLTPIPSRRKLELAFERAIEGGLGLVSDIERHLKRTVIGGLEQPCGELQAPLRKICERRMSHEMRKTLRKHCARHAGFFRQFCKCPCACRLSMQASECSAGNFVARRCKPSRSVRRQLIHVSAQGLNEQRFAELRDERDAAGAL